MINSSRWTVLPRDINTVPVPAAVTNAHTGDAVLVFGGWNVQTVQHRCPGQAGLPEDCHGITFDSSGAGQVLYRIYTEGGRRLQAVRNRKV